MCMLNVCQMQLCYGAFDKQFAAFIVINGTPVSLLTLDRQCHLFLHLRYSQSRVQWYSQQANKSDTGPTLLKTQISTMSLSSNTPNP